MWEKRKKERITGLMRATILRTGLSTPSSRINQEVYGRSWWASIFDRTRPRITITSIEYQVRILTRWERSQWAAPMFHSSFVSLPTDNSNTYREVQAAVYVQLHIDCHIWGKNDGVYQQSDVHVGVLALPHCLRHGHCCQGVVVCLPCPCRSQWSHLKTCGMGLCRMSGFANDYTSLDK